MRLLPALAGAVLVVALAGCAVPVHGRASAAPTTAAAPPTAGPTRGTIPGGAAPACLVGDTCDDDGGSTAPAGLVCAPLPAAMTAFDRQARAAYPGGQLPGGGSTAALGPLTDLVLDVVDRCGFQVMVDVASQYPDPLWTWLRTTAVSALGEIGALPDGLRCADLAALGLGPKQSVDYWVLWGAPALMDADADGIPCETVWPDVARYMPAYW